MKYIQVDIHTEKDGIEPIVSALLKIGITDTVIEDPSDIDDLINKKFDYEWDYIDESVMELKNEKPKVTLFLEDSDEGRQTLEKVLIAIETLKIEAEAGLYGKGVTFENLTVNSTVEDDSLWKDNWKEFFKPAKISENFVVKPTWEEYEKKGNELVLEIDPGMAFGTGTHETTSLCVRLMEQYLTPGSAVLDVGCGSGILSIAAAMLKASEVLGVEIDPVAVEIAQENIRLNHVDDIAKAQYGDLTKGLDFKADLIVANLMADLVMALSKDVAAHLRQGGIYISSGILNEKVPVVVDTMRALNFKILEVKQDGMWSAVVAKLD